MKIIKIDKENPYADMLYDAWDNLFFFMGKRLPWIYLKKVYVDGHKMYFPRWITKRHMDTIDERVQKLMTNLKWED